MSQTPEEIADRIRAYLRDSFPEYRERVDATRPDESLFANGLLDSLGFVSLITFLEETWGFKVPPRDFKPAQFDTVDRMVAYVQRAAAIAR